MKHQIISNDAGYGAAKKWLTSLGTLCAGSMPLAEAEIRVSAMATMLAQNFAATVFCKQSLEHVARQCKFFPAYGEVADALSAWCRENQPARHTALPSPADGDEFNGWDENDHAWLRFWDRHVSEGFANVRGAMRYPGVFPDTAENHRRAHIASLVREKSPKAWTQIVALPNAAEGEAEEAA